MATPHRIVDGAADGLAEGAKGLIGTIADGLKGAGESLMRALDGPPQQLLGREGPHRIMDRFNDGFVDGARHAYKETVQALQITGEGLQSALDHPPQNVGLPPDIGGMSLPLPPRPQIPRW